MVPGGAVPGMGTQRHDDPAGGQESQYIQESRLQDIRGGAMAVGAGDDAAGGCYGTGARRIDPERKKFQVRDYHCDTIKAQGGVAYPAMRFFAYWRPAIVKWERWEWGSEKKEGGEMAVDWLKIKTEYINGNISLRKLAEKSDISYSQLAKVAASEKWNEARESQRIKTESRTNRKTEEKISDALSDEAAAKARIKASMMRLAEGWFRKQESIIAENPDEVVDPAAFRRMVQSCVDLGVVESATGAVNDGDLKDMSDTELKALLTKGESNG